MSDAITRSAKGEDCTVRLPGVCNFDPATTVWSHANGSAAGKGIGMKCLSILGAYACFRCHMTYDRQLPLPEGMTRTDVKLAWYEGHSRSLVKLAEKGLIKT